MNILQPNLEHEGLALSWLFMGEDNIFITEFNVREGHVASDTVRPDQINMAMLFWYLAKSDASVCYCKVGTSHVLQDIRITRPCITGHPVGDKSVLWIRIFSSTGRIRICAF